MRNLKLLLFTIIIFFASITKINSQTRDPYLEELINRAIEVSPFVKSLSSKQDVSRSKVPQVSNLPDPMLNLGLANLPTNSFSFSQEPMTGKIVGLSQAVPFPGKLGAAEKVQSKDIEINQQEIDDKINEIRNEVSQTYYDLRFTREALRIAYENKDLLNKIVQVVRTKYAVSQANQQNIIQVEVEITRVNDKIEELKGKEQGQLASLNALLLKNPMSAILTSNVPQIVEKNVTIDIADSLAVKNRPYLKGIEISKEKAKLMENLAEYEFYPNFNFSVSYSQRDRIEKTNTGLTDFLSVFVGITLPIDYGGKKSSKVEETKFMQALYSNQYNAAMQFLDKAFGKSIARLNELVKREKLIETGLFPQAQQSLEAALAGYKVNAIDFINVIDAQNRLLDVETMLYNIRTQYYKELATLQFLTGSTF